MSPLPQELIDLIIDHLGDDWRALVACAHAHPAWAPRARGCLQSGTILLAVSESPYYCIDFYEFLDIFSSSPTLVPDVSAISFYGRPGATLSSFLPLPAAVTLQYFPHLRSLTFSSFLVEDWTRFMALFTFCESLEALDFEGIGRKIKTGDALGRLTHGPRGVYAGTPCPRSMPRRLKTLRIRDYDYEGTEADSFYSHLPFLFENTYPCPPVHRLSIHLHCPPSTWAHYHQQMGGWCETISGMADSLVDLSMTLPIPLDQFPARNQTRLPSAVVRCHRLSRLTIRYAPVTAGHDDRALFVSALATLFVSPQAIADGTHPDANADAFQLLEVFTAVLPEPHGSDVPGYERELARLAGVLTKDAFPALGCVRIGLEGGSDVPVQQTVGRMDAALEPLRSCRIGSEVAGLREDEWEAWCMVLPVGAVQ